MRITGVDVDKEHEWTEVTFAIRRMAGPGDSADSRSRRWSPLSVARGDFNGIKFRERHPGDYVTDVRGTLIDHPCGSRGDIAAPIVEWLTMLVTDERGGRIGGQTVRYEYLGEEYQTRVDWVMMLCGSGFSDPECGQKSAR